VLFIDDLLDLYDALVAHGDEVAGQVYNVGGGPQHTVSIWTEFGPILERLLGRSLPVSFDDWRPGDQRIYVSNIDKAKQHLGWSPKIGVQEGIERLYNWVVANRDYFE
jgi:CDP-paratose 2-epimerase